jgi:plastocyanin
MEKRQSRPGISRVVLVAALVVVVVVAGIAIYVVFQSQVKSSSSSSSGSTSNTSTNTSTAGTTIFSSSGPSSLMVALSPATPLISPGELQNYSVIQLQTVGSPLAGDLDLKLFSPQGIALSLLNTTAVSLAANPQVVEFSMKAGSGISPGVYNFTLQTSSATLPARNQSFGIQVVPLLVLMDYPTFVPQNASVTKGTTVTWINLNSNIGCCDPGEHDVSFLSGTNETSPLISRLQTWNYTFGADGSYEYYCTVHPIMKGDITVTG